LFFQVAHDRRERCDIAQPFCERHSAGQRAAPSDHTLLTVAVPTESSVSPARRHRTPVHCRARERGHGDHGDVVT
jgi:hypothetical protein